MKKYELFILDLFFCSLFLFLYFAIQLYFYEKQTKTEQTKEFRQWRKMMIEKSNWKQDRKFVIEYYGWGEK